MGGEADETTGTGADETMGGGADETMGGGTAQPESEAIERIEPASAGTQNEAERMDRPS